MNYQVHEMFSSIQGEGVLVGKPSTFIRLQGCNVGCSWCDAKRTWGPMEQGIEWRQGYRVVAEAFIHDRPSLPTDADTEHVRGWIAGYLDHSAMAYSPVIDYALGVVTMFIGGEANAPYIAARLQEQDIHATSLTDIVHIPLSQLQLVADYYATEFTRKMNITRRRTGSRMSVDEIMVSVKEWRNTHVVITGGEPTLYDLTSLTRALDDYGLDIQLETSGQNALKGSPIINWITWSPKKMLNYAASHDIAEEAREVKWVVDAELNVETVLDLWYRYAQRNRTRPVFTFMPEGCPPGGAAIARTMDMLKHAPLGSDWRFTWRLQYSLGVR